MVVIVFGEGPLGFIVFIGVRFGSVTDEDDSLFPNRRPPLNPTDPPDSAVWKPELLFIDEALLEFELLFTTLLALLIIIYNTLIFYSKSKSSSITSSTSSSSSYATSASSSSGPSSGSSSSGSSGSSSGSS